MPVTTRPQDKFAFLFTGHTDTRYKKDLENVFVTLTEYYNYPAGNIWVVWGGPDDLSPGFSGAHIKSINPEAFPKQALANEYTAFATAVNANIPDPAIVSSKNVAVICLTGVGLDSNPVDPFDFPKLVIKPGSPNVTMDSHELKNLLSGIPFSQSHINLIMQQDFADKFTSDLYSNGIFSTDKTVTYVNGSQTAFGDANGGNFTKGWISALRQTDTVQVSGIYRFADELLYTSEPYLISLEQAKEFAGLKYPGETYSLALLGETAFLGKPAFLILDGDNSTVGWWESPDIYLTHQFIPGKKDDLYIPDLPSNTTGPYNNTINVVFRNVGTHPVRCYNLGIQIYRTPLGPSASTQTVTSVDTGTVLKPTNLGGYNVFSNSNKQVYQWETPFYTGITHECIRAKVELPNIMIAFTWDVLTKDSEAQRNTDLSSDPPKSASGPKIGDEFRGNKKHIYTIHNPFKETYKFIITTIPEYQKSLNSVVMNWYVAGKNNKWERIKFEQIENGFKGISFILKGGEVKNILGEFGFMKDPKQKKVRLPVEILIDRISGLKTRTPLAPALRGKFAAISGFTIIMTYEPADILCKVVDKKGNPVQDAIIHIQTINGLQKESIPVNKNGELNLKSINPDVYRIKAIAKAGESIDHIVQLSGGETAKIKLEIISPAQKPVMKK